MSIWLGTLNAKSMLGCKSSGLRLHYLAIISFSLSLSLFFYVLFVYLRERTIERQKH